MMEIPRQRTVRDEPRQSHASEYFLLLFYLFCYCFFFMSIEFLVHFATFMLLFSQDKFLEVELVIY